MSDEREGYEATRRMDAAWLEAWGHELAMIRLEAERKIAEKGLSGDAAQKAVVERYHEKRAEFFNSHPQPPDATVPAARTFSKRRLGYHRAIAAGDAFVERHVQRCGGIPSVSLYHEHWDAYCAAHSDWCDLDLQIISAYTWAALRYDDPEPEGKGAWGDGWGNVRTAGAA